MFYHYDLSLDITVVTPHIGYSSNHIKNMSMSLALHIYINDPLVSKYSQVSTFPCSLFKDNSNPCRAFYNFLDLMCHPFLDVKFFSTCIIETIVCTLSCVEGSH